MLFLTLTPVHRCVYHGDMFPSPESHIGRDLPKKIETMCTARKLYAYGALRDYFVEKNLIGFVRLGDEKHPGGCAVVMSNLPERCAAATETHPGPILTFLPQRTAQGCRYHYERRSREFPRCAYF